MKRKLSLVLALILCAGTLLAQQPLPIRRILLFKNGMAYIVRTGQIAAPLNLAFRPDEMNDVLKTFTAWNPDTSSLYPVGYTTDIAADYLLRRFPFDLRAPGNGMAAFLLQVKGAGVKLDLGARSVSGQLLAVVEEDRAVQQQTVVKDHRLTVLSGDSVQNIWLSDVHSLELLDPALSAQLKSYLQVLAEGRQDVTRDVTVYPTAAGAPAAPVNVAYVQQFPVWKTTYRVDLSKTDSRIQGWSQIDNPTGESWVNVDLTLVSGMPTSFTMNLYEPLYASRQSVAVPSSVVVGPRQYEAALEPSSLLSARVLDQDRIGQLPDDPAERSAYLGKLAGSPDLESASRGVIIDGFSSGVLPGRGGAVGGAPRPQGQTGAQFVPPDTRPRDNGSMQTADASHVDDYFEYRYPFPIQLGSRQSALLPFLNKPIQAERVSIYKSGTDRDHPLNGAWLENNSELPLEPGPMTFFQNGQYAGETVIDYLSRGERRLVSYGLDYDIQADTKRANQPETVAGVTVSRGVMVVSRELTQTTTYRFRNKGQESKTVILEHPREGQRTLKDLKPEETTATFYRFRIKVDPGEEVEFPVVEVLSRQTNFALRDLSTSVLELQFSGPNGANIPAGLRSQLDDIAAQRQKLADLQAQKKSLQKALDSIFADQERLRENIKALNDKKDDRALRQKYLAQLDEQEKQVQDTRPIIADLDKQIAYQDALTAKLISDLKWN